VSTEPLDPLALARERISRSDYRAATTWALIAIAERLQSVPMPAPAGPNLDLLQCNCGHSASQHGMTLDAEGAILMGSLGKAEPTACESAPCDCAGFYTGIELIDGDTYPRRQL
jgi:hypothetical protein